MEVAMHLQQVIYYCLKFLTERKLAIHAKRHKNKRLKFFFFFFVKHLYEANLDLIR